MVLALVGCAFTRRPPEPAVISDSPPPWSAPRDAVSYIRQAQLPELPLDEDSDPWIVHLEVTVADERVEVPAHIGIDRVRAVQAPAHTHEDGGEVWLEGEGNRDVTLTDFFTLWGVRLDAECLGHACGRLRVVADGAAIFEPENLVMWGHRRIEVHA